MLWQVSRDEVKTEERVEKAFEKEGIEIKYFWGSTLYHIDDLPFDLDQMPTNYGGFREKVSAVTVRKSIEAPQHLKGMPACGGVEPGDIPTLAELGVSAPPAVSQVCVNFLTLATCVKKILHIPQKHENFAGTPLILNSTQGGFLTKNNCSFNLGWETKCYFFLSRGWDRSTREA
jgi:DNA photolyase